MIPKDLRANTLSSIPRLSQVRASEWGISTINYLRLPFFLLEQKRIVQSEKTFDVCWNKKGLFSTITKMGHQYHKLSSFHWYFDFFGYWLFPSEGRNDDPEGPPEFLNRPLAPIVLPGPRAAASFGPAELPPKWAAKNIHVGLAAWLGLDFPMFKYHKPPHVWWFIHVYTKNKHGDLGHDLLLV